MGSSPELHWHRRRLSELNPDSTGANINNYCNPSLGPQVDHHTAWHLQAFWESKLLLDLVGHLSSPKANVF